MAHSSVYVLSVIFIFSFSHPYEFELDRFTPPEEQLKSSDPTENKSLDEVPLIMIEKQEQIAPLLEDLLKYKTIAVDLEVPSS